MTNEEIDFAIVLVEYDIQQCNEMIDRSIREIVESVHSKETIEYLINCQLLKAQREKDYCNLIMLRSNNH
jgi:hypothetical protein